MELKYDIEVNLKLLTEIEEIILADDANSVVISSVGACNCQHKRGHLFRGMVLECNPTKTDTLIKILRILEEWSIKNSPNRVS